jgi:hypothetical protein
MEVECRIRAWHAVPLLKFTFPAKLKVEVAIDDDTEGERRLLIPYFAALCFLAALAGWAG